MIKDNFSLAPRNKNFNPQTYFKLESQDKEAINSISTKEARQVYNWNRQVAGDYQRARGFARLKISRYGIVYGKIEPEHYVEDLIANWFLSRFPMFTVMIGSKRGTFVASKDKGVIVYKKKIEELLPDFEKINTENPILSDLEKFNSDTYWEKYYSSQLIKERTNKKYFQRNMPKKYQRWNNLDVENKINSKNRALSEFSLKN